MQQELGDPNQQQQAYYEGEGQEDMYDAYGQEAPQNEEGDGVNALNLQWVLGFNVDVDQGVHNLTTDTRHEIFYSAAHSGVIYDWGNKTQKLLQGHCNQITATACSEDKQWIVTADSGEDSMLIVWDSISGTPVRTFLNPHPDGIKCLDLSTDNQYLVTLGNDAPQTISLWDWTNEKEEGPIVSLQFKYTQEFQNQRWVKFNPRKPTELASNGKERVLFLNWEQGVSQFQYYSPRIEKKDFHDKRKADSGFTKTVFIPGCDMAVTGTSMGMILVWDRSLIIEGIGEQNEKRLIKVVTLNGMGSSINILTTVHDKYLVCGNNDGTIRFYDFFFKIVAWFEDMNFSNIKSISFSKTEPKPASLENQDNSDEVFKCSDFLITDESALICMLQSNLFEEIEPAKRKGYTVMCGIQSSISAIAVHPRNSILAIAGSEGFILLWDYIKKGDPIQNYDHYKRDDPGSKNTDGKVFTQVCFTPDGTEILVAQYNGEIKIMDAQTGTFKLQGTPLKTSDNNSKKSCPIAQLIITTDGKYFATCDGKISEGDTAKNTQAVSLFKKDHLHNDTSKPVEWQFTGKIISHEVEVTSICFAEGLDEQGMPMHRLFSIGKDRRLFEYDVYNSQAHDPLIVLSYFKIEQEALPSACLWYPKKDSKEMLILTANNQYKMKVWNPSAQSSRKTCLGPTYGGEINKMKVLTVPTQEEKYLIYSTQKKVIGLIKMPLDGNPNKTMGLIAHPGEIADFCASADGRYLFTCGGVDRSVKMWSIDVNPIEQAIQFGGEGIEPFINLIEGGRDGQIFQDMQDFFYYSMIRSKDENTTKTRKLDGTVPLDELPNLMRAMGYYPTEQEVQNMKDEVKFEVYSDLGDPQTSVEIDKFIRLFVNHRPVYGIGKNDIEDAFAALAGDMGSLQLQSNELIMTLKQEGEVFGEDELAQSFQYLVGKMLYREALPKDFITAEEFASDVLGFEEYEEGEDEGEGAADGTALGASADQTRKTGGLGGINEAIPEEEGF